MGDITDVRGEELLSALLASGFVVINEADSEATFQGGMESIWVDLTASRWA